jgi:hypothetical protein
MISLLNVMNCIDQILRIVRCSGSLPKGCARVLGQFKVQAAAIQNQSRHLDQVSEFFWKGRSKTVLLVSYKPTHVLLKTFELK